MGSILTAQPFRYPKYVWSPAGGWWAQNANWKRNTKVAALVMVCCCIPVFLTSIKLEVGCVSDVAIPL